MAPLTGLTGTYTSPKPVISPNGHVKQYRVILDPKQPELTIDEAFDELERHEALVMCRRPDDNTLVCGYHVNLWAMPDGWWLADTLGVEGNRVQGETKAEAIELTELGIEKEGQNFTRGFANSDLAHSNGLARVAPSR